MQVNNEFTKLIASNLNFFYGSKQVLKNISKALTKEFGQGFSVQNLRNMRQFYMKF